MRISDWSSDVCSSDLLTASARAFDQLGLSGNAVYDLVSQGVYDVGTTVMDYVAGDVPRVEGADIPAIADPAKMREMIEAYRPERTSVVWGKRVAVRVDLGGRQIIKKKNDRASI